MSGNSDDNLKGIETNSNASSPERLSSSLSVAGCVLVLSTAFLGWMFSGVQMAINSVAMRNASEDLLQREFVELGISSQQEETSVELDSVQSGFDADHDGKLSPLEKTKAREGRIGQWFGWMIAAFLLGAAAGGYVFGWVGDRCGRAKAMGWSILCYSLLSGISTFVQEPWQLWWLRFFTCMGIGGMWPNGIALVSEAWPNISRPVLAGAIGTAANVGITAMSLIAIFCFVTTENWHWVMWLGSTPVLLGVFVLLAVPESPRWLALRSGHEEGGKSAIRLSEIFRPPVLKATVLGIALGTIPLFGGWGSSNWANAWASQIGDTTGAQEDRSQAVDNQNNTQVSTATSEDELKQPASQRAKPNASLKAWVVFSRSAPGSVSSLLGGALALWLGRRRCYFIISLGALVSAQVLFWFNEPGNPWFLFWNGSLGFFSGFFFGWLPLCLPEMFPTRVRSTGAGVSFNWGRILTAVGVVVAAGLLKTTFDSDYAAIGRLTSLIYALGMVVIFFAPDNSRATLDD
ncbi:MAG: hypothetical protein CMJ81_01135 [Planctomycetaceae bacterium]|nr:hypothetical protein [Planctomycetaceae bacterium]